mmetsp:Transcript_86841/g.202123  ORF Transcript_86841/g.202123 Transcript_86841/m.202123 type:complete len:619 (-) Transcript_86841:381-2237(-)|eukprot:CAMPEP_0171071930 /NCGR_PEP_ID=MMETSP0766_2-20121228/10575_1 /TAXON_ID=439317 /ORGANISM="Gambierdiscus australes, Strain CAWD 149" /LENGTH=618 /DNA_ID=CAMNT_0011528485 /DNA_START=53 /DNA_END=1909 /DNA_ORIENTATION=+
MPQIVENDLSSFIRTEVLKLEEQFGKLAEKQTALQSLMSKVHHDVVCLLSMRSSGKTQAAAERTATVIAEAAEKDVCTCNSNEDGGSVSWERVSQNGGGGGGGSAPVSVSALPPVTAARDTLIHPGYVSAMVRDVLYAIEKQERELGCTTRASFWHKYEMIEQEGKLKLLEMALDSAMGAVILLNALFLGLQLDYRDGSVAWTVVDGIFSVAFALELATKILVRGGLSNYFCGHEAVSNVFDTLLVLTDAAQLFLEALAWDAARILTGGGSPSASLFRVVRLIRLTRLVRLLRSEKFKSLLTMIQGILDGLMTLGWAIVLFILIVYVTALLSLEAFGRKDEEDQEDVSEYFRTVPRSLFTIFRCSFGDCTTDRGTPLFEHIATTQGPFATLCCSAFLFFMVMGLFNVISAIFVDTTMAAAAAASVTKQLARLDDEQLWARSVATIIKCLLNLSPEHKHLVDGGMLFRRTSDAQPRDTENVMSELFNIGIHTSVMDSVVLDKEVVEALQALDIDASDHKKLSDILDPDHSGRITILELVEGLQRLRGQPRRSDTVMVDLMIRSLQRMVEEMKQDVQTIADSVRHVDFGALASSVDKALLLQKEYLDLYRADGGESELSI